MKLKTTNPMQQLYNKVLPMIDFGNFNCSAEDIWLTENDTKITIVLKPSSITSAGFRVAYFIHIDFKDGKFNAVVAKEIWQRISSERTNIVSNENIAIDIYRTDLLTESMFNNNPYFQKTVSRLLFLLIQIQQKIKKVKI
ncbi:hypothetical protein I6I87_07610 [Moraxella osloensis]|nr:hypothetical protein [Moraxella osloensis]QQU05971.1 hypothetical protein I6I87_07610 [Moraxella osloensis]